MTKHIDIHLKTPPPGAENCDFCGSVGQVKWAYPARQGFEMGKDEAKIAPNLEVHVFSADDFWAACDECAALIESSQRDELAKRSAKVFQQKHANERLPFSKTRLVAMIRGAHDNFWANREGSRITADDYRRKILGEHD